MRGRARRPPLKIQVSTSGDFGGKSKKSRRKRYIGFTSLYLGDFFLLLCLSGLHCCSHTAVGVSPSLFQCWIIFCSFICYILSVVNVKDVFGEMVDFSRHGVGDLNLFCAI